MSTQLTPKHALVIWNLIITGDQPMMSKVQPDLSPAERKVLLETGLIQLDRRGRATHIVLEDKAWDWAVENFDAQLSLSKYAVPVLQTLLIKMNKSLQKYNISLAEFLAVEGQSEPDIQENLPVENDLESSIRKAYMKVSGGQPSVRVRLADLRQHLGEFSRSEVDRVLGEMELSEKLVLMHLDDPQEINPEDDEAAVEIGGHKSHIVYLQV
ncbi:hypothetical protein [Sphaerothrix gracilis]|uniref:hypothetical protein n=1 Tax=Sphaerothrix gracilis TaxID=3151835 RepID=UPI0031FD3FE6